MKKISVIVPVYNAEAYIEQCIQSPIGQTYQNWEALLIDNGSTNHSLEVCRCLGRADARIQVYPPAEQRGFPPPGIAALTSPRGSM